MYITRFSALEVTFGQGDICEIAGITAQEVEFGSSLAQMEADLQGIHSITLAFGQSGYFILDQIDDFSSRIYHETL
jgi:hypothetical protein